MSRVTPDERRGVAKGLRYIANCRPPVQRLEQFRGALEDELFTGPGHANYTGIFTRLADLIDPTCKYLPNVHAAWFDDNDEEHEDTSLEAFKTSENAYCSVCGYEMMTGEEGWFDYEHKEHGNRLIPRFNYCPNCGARVVRDEA